MRKAVVLLLLLLIVSGMTFVTGCGREPVLDLEEYYRNKEKGEVKVKTEEGEATISREIDEEELGAPVYPGAELDDTTTQKTEATGEEGKIGLTSAAFWTNDPITEVITWYRNALSGESGFKETSSLTAGSEMGQFSYKSVDRSVNIIITKDTADPNRTVISIISGTGQP